MIGFNFRYPMPKEDTRSYLHQLIDYLRNTFAAIKTGQNGTVETVFIRKEWSVGNKYSKHSAGVEMSYLKDHTVFIAHFGSAEWPVVCVKTGGDIVGSLSIFDGAAMHTCAVVISYDPIEESITLKQSTYDGDTDGDIVALYAVI